MTSAGPAGLDALMDAWQAAWSGRDPAAFEPVCAPDLHYEDPLTEEPLQGPGELAAHAQRLWHALPDARLEPTGERLGNGRYAVAPFRLMGRHTASLEGLPASGRPVALHALFYCELDPAGRRLWRVRTFFDAYDAGMQVGVLPRRGTLGEKAMLMLRGFGVRPARRGQP